MPSTKDKVEGVMLTARQQQIAIRSAERQKIICRALELANSGRFSDWNAIEDFLRLGSELCRDPNPFHDLNLRQELDARCSTSRAESRLSFSCA
jgi:hypothetical protein